MPAKTTATQHCSLCSLGTATDPLPDPLHVSSAETSPRHGTTLWEKTPPLPSPRMRRCPAAEPLGKGAVIAFVTGFCFLLAVK